MDFASVFQLVHYITGHVGGNGEANPDIAARRRKDLAIDPDQLPAGIHQRAARITSVDWRVGLQKVLKAAVAQTCRTALRTDNSSRYRLTDTQRVADREADVADSNSIRVAQSQHG